MSNGRFPLLPGQLIKKIFAGMTVGMTVKPAISLSRLIPAETFFIF